MFEQIRMPAFGGATEWLNGEPLDRPGPRGRAILVNFWTLTCINWLRQEPYVRAWSRAYRDDGLVVVGVHTPEFTFEQELDRVRLAVAMLGIDYPVAIDNEYKIWSAFDNHFWPALYFLDSDGVVRDAHFGEGRYEESERVIQQLLGVEEREHVATSTLGMGVEAPADWDHLRTPETYLGYARGEGFASAERPAPDQPHDYSLPSYLPFNHWSLDGQWTIGRERLLLDRPGGSIACRFQARDAHLVLSHEGAEPIPFRVLVDGMTPDWSHGVDVDEQGVGLLDEGRLYQLWRETDEVRERTLEITFEKPGAEAYAFTFG
jgi:hypothetical protein